MSLCRKLLLAISLFLCCALLFGTANRVATAKPTCAPASQRTIFLAVENKAGAPVENLRLEDLSLLEDNTSREILKLERRTNESLSVAILIDVSMSQERTLPRIKLAAQELVEVILKNAKARATVISFTGDATVEEDLTNDLAKLRTAIARIEFVPPSGYIGPGVVLGPPSSPSRNLAGSTAIWDAIWATTDGMLKGASDSRRAIVLFSDGEDTASNKKLSAAIKYAARYEVAVFAIGVADKNFGGANRDSLNKLAEQTGGRAFFPKKPDESAEIFRQIDQEIRSQYLLTYCAAEAGTAKAASEPPKIKIQLNKSQSLPDMRLLYRRYGF